MLEELQDKCLVQLPAFEMRRTRNRDVVLFLCLCALYFHQTCSVSLQIMERYAMHDENKAEGVRVGTIKFGRGVNSLGPKKDEVTRHVGNGIASISIQADLSSAGLVGGRNYIDDFSSSETAWDRMQPTVYCTKDFMKFSAKGPGSSSLQLDQAGGTPLFLNQLPQDCGYSVYDTVLGLVFLIPYDGCDVINRSGYHMLLMWWEGNPVTLACPMSSSTLQSRMDPPLEPLPMHVKNTPQATSTPSHQDQQDLQQLIHSYYQSPFKPPMQAKAPSQTTAASTEAASSTTMGLPQNPQPAQQLINPYFMYPGYPNPFMPVKAPPQTTAAPTTTEATSSTASKLHPQDQEQQQQLPNSYFMYPGYPNPFMPVKAPPQTTAAPTTTEATSTTASKLPPQDQQQQQLMQQQQLINPYYMYPRYSNPFMPVKAPPETTEAPTTAAPTTTEATSSTASKLPPQDQQLMQQQQQQQHQPFPNPYFMYPGYPNPYLPVKAPPQTTAAPTTEAPSSTVSKLPPQDQQQQQFPNPYYLYPGYPNPYMPVKAPPQTTAAPTTKEAYSTIKPSNQDQAQQHFLNAYHFCHQYFVMPPPPMPAKAPASPAAPTTISPDDKPTRKGAPTQMLSSQIKKSLQPVFAQLEYKMIN